MHHWTTVDKNPKLLKQFVVYDSEIPVTWKQGQVHQTWYEMLDPQQGHNQAKIERPFHRRWSEKGVDHISHLLHEHGAFLDFEKFKMKYDLMLTFSHTIHVSMLKRV